MPWLIAFIASHLTAIAIIGTVAGTIASVESVAINTDTIIQKIEEKKE